LWQLNLVNPAHTALGVALDQDLHKTAAEPHMENMWLAAAHEFQVQLQD